MPKHLGGEIRFATAVCHDDYFLAGVTAPYLLDKSFRFQLTRVNDHDRIQFAVSL